MPTARLRARGARGAVMVLAAAALAAPAAAPAAPRVADLARADRAVAREQAAVAAELEARRAALADARGDLERARANHRAALATLTRRLRAAYAEPDPGPLARVLAADPADAGDAVDLARAIGRSDRAMVARYRTAVRRLEAQAGRVATEKRGLAARERDLAARRVVTRGDLAAARRRAAARARRAAATQAVSVPLAATAAWGLQAPFTPGPVARPNEGGLPAEVVSARSLPGTLLTDAAGRPQVAAPVSTPTAGAPPVVAVPDGTVIPGAQAAPALTTLVASWYGDELRGSATANGERFDPGAMTAAHKTLPFGTLLRVTLGSRWVVVRVNDRGPYVAGRDLDLSQAAAQAVGLGGVGPVQVEVLPGTAAGG